MEVKEVQCYRLSKNFSILDSDTCSSDNDFAVIVRNGVHVLSFVPNLVSNDENFNVKRSFIRIQDEFPQVDISIDFEKLNREKFCLLTLDWKLTPTLDKYVSANIYARQIGFINFPIPARPFLGVISNQGCFQLYAKCDFEWQKMIDISLLWKNHALSLWSSEIKDDFDSMNKKLKFLRTVSFTYCEGFVLEEGSKSSLLASICETGVVAFWEIENGTAALMNTVELEILVQTLHWHYLSEKFGWIIAGCSDGSVKIYFCKKGSSNEITLTLLHELWKETDQIIASHIKVRKQGSRSLLVFSKENALLLFSFQNKEIASYIHEFDKKIVGLEILDDSCIFVILSNHQAFNLSIKNEKCVCVPVPIKISANYKKYSVRGVSFSRNKVFCVVSMGIARHFDPLIVKEPWCLLLCTTKKEIPFSAVRDFVRGGSLYQAFDYIEFFRYHSLKNKTCIDRDTLTLMWSALDGEIKDCYSEFQFLYILSQCSRSNQESSDLLVIEIVFTICNFIYYADSVDDKRSHYYFNQWLRANLSKLPDSILEFQRMKNISKSISDPEEYIVEEKCKLCSSELTDHSSIKFIICEKGHNVLRCSRSFVPVTNEPHSGCSICNSVVLKSAGAVHCSICDSILEINP